MKITKETIVGQLVAQDYRTATVFKQNEIDFCCNGNRSIADACAQKGIDADKMVKKLENLFQENGSVEEDYNSWPLDQLIDHIEKRHHHYVKARIPEIIPFLEKVASVHGERHSELWEVERLFKEAANNLLDHMGKEEQVLFPHIKRMIQSKRSGISFSTPFGTIQNPIGMMMSEHDAEGERFRKIAHLTGNYAPPADACNTYKVTLALIKEFEDDLHLHIHLENNILFPKSVAMENALIV